YQAYYSLKPIISNWNNNFNGKINPIILNPPNLNVLNKSFSYDLINNSDYYEIKHISGNDEEGHSISFEFSPAIPNLLSLRSKSKMRGKFSCIIDKKIWIFAGKYYLNRTGDTILFKITPTKGWQPLPGKLWLKSYKWTSKIEIRDIGNIIINSYWRRING
ncbi:MAG: hypothetical protein ACFE8G_13800, partial [Candidatus Hermodarchaeota archaeon]